MNASTDFLPLSCGSDSPTTEGRPPTSTGEGESLFRCAVCGKEMPRTAEYFYVNKTYTHGFEKRCKWCSKELVRKYSEKNKEKVKEAGRRYWIRNKARIYLRNRAWTQKNRIKVNADYRKWRKKHRLTISERVAKSCRGRVQAAIKHGYKAAKTLDLIGCSTEQLMRHLENQFSAGMSFDNYGYRGWHIDHIVPCASFDLTKPEEQRKCFHWSNLQPMWAKKNIGKGCKTDGQFRLALTV